MSDGIVLSVDANMPDAFSKLFMIISLFSNSLISLNPPRFTRGAIVQGNIYHENNIVFGPLWLKKSHNEWRNRTGRL